MFGVHIVTSPVPCPKHMTPFIRFYAIDPGGPRLVFASEMTCPIETSKYLSCPLWDALTSK